MIKNIASKCYECLKKYTINVIFVCIMIFYLISCTLTMYSKPAYNVWFLSLLVLGVYFLLYLFFDKMAEKKNFVILSILFCISFAIYILWNITCRTVPISDYQVLINGAETMLDGNFKTLSFDKQNYFYFYNFQTGFVMYLALIMKIFGTRLMALKIVSAVFLSLSNVLVYMIGAKVYNRKIGFIASMMYTTLLFNISGSSIINNQHVSLMFVLLGIYCFVMNDKILSKIFCGIFSAVAIILRPSAVIFVIGIVCFMIWKLVAASFREWKKFLIFSFVIIFVTTGFLKAYDFVLRQAEIVPISAVSGNLKYFKFILGTQGEGLTGNPTTSAEKTQVYYDLEQYDFDYDKYNDACKEHLINKFTENFAELKEYISTKLLYFTGDTDNQIYFAVDNVTNTVPQSRVNFFTYYGYAQYFLLVAGIAISSVCSLKKNRDYLKKDNYDILFKIIFIGYFLIHIVIEVQTRYRYDQYLLMCFILAPYMFNSFEFFKLKLDDIKNVTLKSELRE